MVGWIHITLAATTAGIFLLLFLLFKRIFRHPKPPPPPPEHPPLPHHISKPLFNWSDNPSLITDAIENGWSRFAFTDHVSSSSVRSNRSNRFVISSCAAGSVGKSVNTVNNAVSSAGVNNDVEISWEVCQESADFMQKIRLNPGLKKVIKTTTSAMVAASVIKSSLPLPGPALGNSIPTPFPQEAYFEITVLSGYESERGRLNMEEGENVNLIKEKGVDERGVHVILEELRGRSAKDLVEGEDEVVIMLSVGLTAGGSIPAKLPGSYPGSVGYNSDGSIYLDGIKLVSESNTERWERIEKVIGCGYNPSQKKVFFTLDSKLVHEINCKEEEFGTPLYPTIAANIDSMVLVNFGQSTFKYPPANLQRTQNPCFIGPMTNSSSLEYEDSKELFSMGRIDSQWLHQATRSGAYHGNVNIGKMKECDEGLEGDLFEIMIEKNNCKKSPRTLH